MMPQRFVLMFALVAAGCVASIPNDCGISADLATEAARMMLVLRKGAPPAPSPSGKCENCTGTGKVRSGDGIEVFDCPVCGGTGIAVESVLHPAVVIPPNAERRP